MLPILCSFTVRLMFTYQNPFTIAKSNQLITEPIISIASKTAMILTGADRFLELMP